MSIRTLKQKSKIFLGTALLLSLGFVEIDKLAYDHHQKDRERCLSESPDDPLTLMLVATVIVHVAYIITLLASSVKMLQCAWLATWQRDENFL